MIEARFIEAKPNGKYIRGQMLSGSGGVTNFYVDTERDPEAGEVLLGMSELDPFIAEADVYANTPRGGGQPYLSVKIVAVKKKGRAAASAG
jgi:hypothetical protein